MEKTLNIIKNYAKFDNNCHILCDDEPLVIKINGLIAGLTHIASINNGVNNKDILIKNSKIEIPYEMLKIGEIKITICSYKESDKIEEYQCERLLIKRVERKKIVIPELENYKQEIKQYKNEVERLNKNLETITAFISEVYGIDVKLGGNK